MHVLCFIFLVSSYSSSSFHPGSSNKQNPSVGIVTLFRLGFRYTAAPPCGQMLESLSIPGQTGGVAGLQREEKKNRTVKSLVAAGLIVWVDWVRSDSAGWVDAVGAVLDAVTLRPLAGTFGTAAIVPLRGALLFLLLLLLRSLGQQEALVAGAVW